MAELSATLDRIVRRDRSRIVGALLRLCGTLDAAEEALQQALVSALAAWPTDGVPDEPVAWLTTAAKNHARDAWRRRAVADAKAPRPEEETMGRRDTVQSVTDDQLRLIVTCCHPALAREAQVALTLKVIAGFSIEELARAFVCPETAMAQRIVRAKRTIEEAGVAYAVPDTEELRRRLAPVLEVVYLIFNEGHTASTGPLVRLDLQAEALRLGRMLADLAPREPAVFGVLAMMAFSAARARTRVDDDGVLLLLSEQDRARWDVALIEEGLLALQRARSLDPDDTYVIQAEIAACHAASPAWEATRWPAILGHYDRLLEATRSPVVALNRAIAVAMIEGPARGLAELRDVEKPLADYYLFHATRADFLRKTGADPRAAYERALALATNDSERAFLQRRLDDVERS